MLAFFKFGGCTSVESRQTGRRLPIGVRPVVEEMEEYTPPEPERRPMNLPQNLPPANQQGSLNPPALNIPTQSADAAPMPNQFASAATQPSPPSGPVDRARFAALFPEDRELLGIGSLMGQG